MAQFRDYQPTDCAALLAIYNHAICHSSATFEESPISLSEFAARLSAIQAHYPILVLEHDGKLQGYAYGNHYKPRSAYRFCAETTIYLHQDCRGTGLGQLLYQALFTRLQAQGIEQLLAIVTRPNEQSAGFHQRLGYEQVGVMRRVGYKFNRWYDVAIYQKSLIESAS
ncbi:GNAT family N-acetyltransferase [uncultured Ferrimonas sp.]|uniref:GNAT family N-acetyltransferase n=1 Tax=uncultured Ferrimonas sp. TaxID=432640 RepID=UPI00262BEB4F|nr:GNAT family N-acetyltransferase [uncultured Ferrimonas sp.]